MLCYPELKKEIYLDEEDRLSLIELENAISIIWRMAATTNCLDHRYGKVCGVATPSLMGKRSGHFL